MVQSVDHRANLDAILQSEHVTPGGPMTDAQATAVVARAREAHIPENLINQSLQASHFTHKAAISGAVSSRIRSDTAEAQTILTRLSYDTHGIDGRVGTNTRTAIESFQRDVMGMDPPTGVLDPATMAELRNARDNDNVSFARQHLGAARDRYFALATDQHVYAMGDTSKTRWRYTPEQIARMPDKLLEHEGFSESLRAAARRFVALDHATRPNAVADAATMNAVERERRLMFA